MSQDLFNLLALIFGVGGIGTAVLNGIFGKKKADADSFKTITMSLAETSQALMELAEKRIVSLTSRTGCLEDKIATLEAEITELKNALIDKEQTIQLLQQENSELQSQVDELKKENRAKDRRIEDLSKKVKELTSRLNAMTNGDCNDKPGP